MDHPLSNKTRTVSKLASFVPVALIVLIYIANRISFESKVISALAISLVCVWYWLHFKSSRYLSAVAALVLTGAIAPAISEDLYQLNIRKTLELVSVVTTASIVTILSRVMTGSQLATEAKGEQSDFNHRRHPISISDIVFSLLLLPVPIYWWSSSYDHDISESLIVATVFSLTAIGVWCSFRTKHSVSKYLRMLIIVASCFCSIYLLTPIRIDPHRSLFYFYRGYYGIGVTETLICIAITMIFVCSGEYCRLKMISNRPPATMGRFLSKFVQYALVSAYLGFLLVNLLLPHGYDSEAIYRSDYIEVGWPQVFQITEKVGEKTDFVFGDMHDVYGVKLIKSAFIIDGALITLLIALFGLGMWIIFGWQKSNWSLKGVLWNGVGVISGLSSIVILVAIALSVSSGNDNIASDSPFFVFSKDVRPPLIERIFHESTRGHPSEIAGKASDLQAAGSLLGSVESIRIDRVDAKIIEILKTYPKLRSLSIDSEPIDGDAFSELTHQLKLEAISLKVDRGTTLVCDGEHLKDLVLTSEIDENQIIVRDAKKLNVLDVNLYGNNSSSLLIENCHIHGSTKISTFCGETNLKINDCISLGNLNFVGDKEYPLDVQYLDVEIANSKIETLFCGNLSPRKIITSELQMLPLFLRYYREASENLYSDLSCENVTTVFFMGYKAGALALLKNASKMSNVVEIGLMLDDIEYETFWDEFDQFDTPCIVKVSPSALELGEQQLEQLRTNAPPKFELLDSLWLRSR